MQKSWDIPCILARAASLLQNVSDPKTKAHLLAVSTHESGAPFNALPISSLGLRMNDETVRIAIGLHLGAPLCQPHSCSHCGVNVNHFGTHGLSCRKSQARHYQHSSINDIIHQSLSSISVPTRLEPLGLFQSHGKRPDGMSIISRSSERLLVWDATCSDTFAYSNLSAAVTEAGAVALQTEKLKNNKYSTWTLYTYLYL